jgi:hypothetical protein
LACTSAASGIIAFADGSDRNYGDSGSVDRAGPTIDAELIAEPWHPMGQFNASLRNGHVSASVAVRRLVTFRM